MLRVASGYLYLQASRQCVRIGVLAISLSMLLYVGHGETTGDHQAPNRCLREWTFVSQNKPSGRVRAFALSRAKHRRCGRSRYAPRDVVRVEENEPDLVRKLVISHQVLSVAAWRRLLPYVRV